MSERKLIWYERLFGAVGGPWAFISLIEAAYLGLISISILRAFKAVDLPKLMTFTVIPFTLFLPLNFFLLDRIVKGIRRLLSRLDDPLLLREDKRNNYRELKDFFSWLIFGPPMWAFVILVEAFYLLIYRGMFFFPSFFRKPSSVVIEGYPLTLEFQLGITLFLSASFSFLGSMAWLIFSFFSFAFNLQRMRVLREEVLRYYLMAATFPDFLYLFGDVSLNMGLAVMSTMLLVPNYLLISYLPMELSVSVPLAYVVLITLIVMIPLLGFIRPVEEVKESVLEELQREVANKIKEMKSSNRVFLSDLRELEELAKLYSRIEDLSSIPLRPSKKRVLGYIYLFITTLLGALQILG